MWDRSGPTGPTWEADAHEAAFAKLDTLSDCFDNRRTARFECPPARVDSKSNTHLSMCLDRFAPDAENCRRADSALFQAKESSFESQLREQRGRARMRGA